MSVHLQTFMTGIFESYGKAEKPQPCPTPCVDCRQRCNHCCHDQYYGQRGIRYSCERIKATYVLKLMCSHVAHTIEPALMALKQCGQSSPLRVLGLGGGPGTEALALLDALAQERKAGLPARDLLFHNCDIEPSWEPYFRDIMKRYSSVTGINVTPSFQRLDLAKGFRAPSPFDIVFVPWVLSELPDERKGTVVTQAAAIARLLVVTERVQSSMTSEIDRLLCALPGWVRVGSKQDHRSWAGVSFPEEIAREFTPQFSFRTAYWVMRSP
jgi:hypothetical protein